MKVSSSLHNEIRAFSKMLHKNNLAVQIKNNAGESKAVIVHKELGTEHNLTVSGLNNSVCIFNPSGKGANPIEALIQIMNTIPRVGSFEFRHPSAWEGTSRDWAESAIKNIDYSI